MELSALREKLHELIDNSSEDKLQQVYSLLEDEEYSNELKEELDEEFENYKKDKEVISKEDLDAMVDRLLYGRK